MSVPHHDHPGPPVPRTPEAIEHAQEARDLQRDMADYGIQAERVAPTRDNQGHIRMRFAAMHRIIDLLDDAYDGKLPEGYEVDPIPADQRR